MQINPIDTTLSERFFPKIRKSHFFCSVILRYPSLDEILILRVKTEDSQWPTFQLAFSLLSPTTWHFPPDTSTPTLLLLLRCGAISIELLLTFFTISKIQVFSLADTNGFSWLLSGIYIKSP